MVRNVFKYIKANDPKKLMNSWTDNTTMNIVKHKKAPKANWVLLTLEHDDMVAPFLELFKDGKLTNKKGHVMKCHRAAEHDGKQNAGETETSNHKRAKSSSTPPQDCIKTPSEVRDKLTPLWNIPYSQQLDQKTRTIVNKCLKRIISELKSKFRSLQKEVPLGRGGSHECGSGVRLDHEDEGDTAR